LRLAQSVAERIADTVADVLTAIGKDTEALNGTLNQLCAYAAEVVLIIQGGCHG
jgi:hypothetical protein